MARALKAQKAARVGSGPTALEIGRATSRPTVTGASGTTSPKRPADPTPALPTFTRGAPADVASALGKHAPSGTQTPGPFAGPDRSPAPSSTGAPAGVPAAGSGGPARPAGVAPNTDSKTLIRNWMNANLRPRP